MCQGQYGCAGLLNHLESFLVFGYLKDGNH